MSQSDGEAIETEDSCGASAVKVEGTEEEQGLKNRDVSGEKTGEVDGKEEGTEGKDEGVAVKMPKKRGRKKKAAGPSKKGKNEIVEDRNVEGKSFNIVAVKEEETGDLEGEGVSLKRPKKEIVEERNVEGKRSDIVDVKEEESVEKLEERINGEDGTNKKDEVDLGAADNGKINSGDDDYKKRLRRGVSKSYAEVPDYDDELFEGKHRRKRRQKGKSAQSEGQKDVKEGGKEEQGGNLGVADGKKRGRRGLKKDEKVAENGKSCEKSETNDKPRYPLRTPGVPKKEETVPYTKKQKDPQVKKKSF